MTLDRTQYRFEQENFFDDLPENSFEKAFCIFGCPIEDSVLWFRKKTLEIRRCKCGFVFNHHQPKSEILSDFYEKSDAIKTWSAIKDSEEERKRQDEKFDPVVDSLIKDNAKSVLDIGCGNGVFLQKLKEKIPGVLAKGFDSSLAAVKSSREKGLDVDIVPASTSTNDLINLFNEIQKICETRQANFDAICLFGTLEHLKNPFEMISGLKQYLKRYGKMFVIVPNECSTAVRLFHEKAFTFCPQHLWYFNAFTVRHLFEKCGLWKMFYSSFEFEEIPIYRHMQGHDPYKSLPNWQYVDVYAINDIKNNVKATNSGYKLLCVGVND